MTWRLKAMSSNVFEAYWQPGSEMQQKLAIRLEAETMGKISHTNTGNFPGT
jgi:hypothetical protein